MNLQTYLLEEKLLDELLDELPLTPFSDVVAVTLVSTSSPEADATDSAMLLPVREKSLIKLKRRRPPEISDSSVALVIGVIIFIVS